MSDRFLIDTNVLVYAYSDTDLDMKRKARAVINQPGAMVSTQALQELSSVLFRKMKLNWDLVGAAIDDCAFNCTIHTNTIETVKLACQVAHRYQYAFYDSLMLAAALEAGAHTIYSQDLQHGQNIFDRVKVLNPFKEGVLG